MREQGRQNFLKGDARQDAIIPGQRREGREGGASARDGSVSGPGPARPERGRGHSESESQSENRAEIQTEETCRDGRDERGSAHG